MSMYDPWGELEDLIEERSGQVCGYCVYYELRTGACLHPKNPKPGHEYSAKDFCPRFERVKKPPTSDRV